MEKIQPISRRSRLDAPLAPERVQRREPSDEDKREREARQKRLKPKPPRSDGSAGRHIDVRA